VQVSRYPGCSGIWSTGRGDALVMTGGQGDLPAFAVQAAAQQLLNRCGHPVVAVRLLKTAREGVGLGRGRHKSSALVDLAVTQLRLRIVSRIPTLKAWKKILA